MGLDSTCHLNIATGEHISLRLALFDFWLLKMSHIFFVLKEIEVDSSCEIYKKNTAQAVEPHYTWCMWRLGLFEAGSVDQE